jgi:hypothetical protein
MSRFGNLICVALALVGGVTLAVLPEATAVASGQGSPTPPHIVARPASQMVNHPIKLVGTGFVPRSTLTIKECSRTSWVVNQNPCANNAITVATNSNGTFRGTITAVLCPKIPGRLTPRPAETCYVGEPVPRGVDGIRLLGAAQITVTYP